MIASLASWLRAHQVDLAWALAIFAVAFALRLATVLWLDISPLGLLDDSWFYHHSARSIADGDGYVFPLQGGAPTARWPPAIPPCSPRCTGCPVRISSPVRCSTRGSVQQHAPCSS